MPFYSKKQQKACYASKGFGGKVDCAEWSKETKKKGFVGKKATKKKK
jgi:hypothetical protein